MRRTRRPHENLSPPRRILFCILLGVAMGACRSAEVRCGEAQAAAAQAWRAYVEAMQQDLTVAEERTADIQRRMLGDIDRRLSQRASAEASRLHDRDTAAWHRAYAARLQAACSADEECSALRVETRTLEQTRSSLRARIAAATAAAAASGSDRMAAKAAADAVKRDFEYPSSRDAHRSSEDAYATCDGVGRVN